MRQWVGVCPFHSNAGGDEAEAGCGGSVVDWVMCAEGVSFRHAVELLHDGHTSSRSDRPPPVLLSVSKLETAAFSAELSDG